MMGYHIRWMLINLAIGILNIYLFLLWDGPVSLIAGLVSIVAAAFELDRALNEWEG